MIQKHLFNIFVFVQLILMLIAFNKAFTHSDNYLFENSHDGIKNHFTFHTFVSDLDEPNPFKYNGMNYPYGDYVFFTDNTPLLSVPVRLFSQYIYDVSPWSTLIYNLFFILGQLLCAMIAFKFLSLFIPHKYWVFILALAFTWINPQVVRYMNGTVNLSFAWLVVLMAYLFCKWSMARMAADRREIRKYLILMMLTIIIGSFIHLYYLAVLGLTIGFMAFIQACFEYKSFKKAVAGLAQIMVVGAVSFVFVFVTIKLIDQYDSLRKATAEGYNWEAWKLSFSSFFTAYDWNQVEFPVESTQSASYESSSYLGTFALYGACVLALLAFFNKMGFSVKKALSNTTNGRLVLILFLSGCWCFVTGLGTRYVFFNGEMVMHNLIHPFYFLDDLIPALTQFRCLGRFSWFFFWGSNLIVAYLLLLYFQERKGIGKWVVVSLLFALLILDTKDTVQAHNRRHSFNTLTYDAHTTEMQQLLKDVDAREYQAILPLPYYHVGSEVTDYTFDPDDRFCTYTYQAAILTDLPLMACKMSRTAVSQAVSLWSLVDENPVDVTLLEKLSDKPILVLYGSHLFKKPGSSEDSEPTTKAYQDAQNKIQEYQMQALAKNENLELFRLEVSELR